MALKKLSDIDFSSVVNEPKAVVTDTGETGGAVRSPYDIPELNSYLYDSDLQNVFKDYQENIAILNVSEQQKLEDAYYIREMSKKYLGEYASNTGVGDVSGNLLDIYGNYQKSKADIKSKYDALELNLTQEYRAEKTALQGISNQIDKQNKATDIIKNLVTGNYGEGVDGLKYLESVRETIGPEAYQTYYAKIYADLVQEAFGDEKNGIKYFDPETMTIDEYVQIYVDKGLSTTHAKELKEYLAPIVENYEKAKIDPTIGLENSKNYIGADYNFHVNTGGENVGKDSYMYQDANRVKTFAVLDDSEADEAVSGWYASHEDLMKTFKDENKDANPKTGDEVEYSAYKAETEETQTFTYVYQNGRFHRMVQEDIIDPSDMAFWRNTDGLGKDGKDRRKDHGRKVTSGKDFEIDNRYDGSALFPLFFDWKNWNEPDTFVYKGKKYVEGDEFTGIHEGDLGDLDVISGADRGTVGDPHSDLKKLFNKVHGDASTGDAVVYYNNNFYIRKTDGKIYIMNEEE